MTTLGSWPDQGGPVRHLFAALVAAGSLRLPHMHSAEPELVQEEEYEKARLKDKLDKLDAQERDNETGL